MELKKSIHLVNTKSHRERDIVFDDETKGLLKRFVAGQKVESKDIEDKND